ncbi:fungal-specific transcription factor domain-containing protein [Penicillium angulare]|uniref:fungal-specific transcription factor domain-containing protein n=1 Tax=Penicillium angulare TaxID=116970 RepID=UPI002541DEF4|nr:fungal-specific transcription factor domain-containing protein [Penicillium angulare]KAJ5286705.1 fungal-specific transcription factor domain-containing protein [Penicillium angulare]
MDALHELQNSKQSFMRVNRQRGISVQRKSRSTVSCFPCRQRKVKCDRLAPCGQCTRRSSASACDYLPNSSNAETLASVSPTITSISTQGTIGDIQPDPVAPTDENLVPPTPNIDHTKSPAILCNHPPPSTPVPVMGSIESLTPSCFHGSGTRTRYFGRSHWALTLDMTPRFETLLPPRNITDKLVEIYFLTFETTFRVLHAPQFLAEYEAFWTPRDNTSSNSWPRDVFVAKLLGAIACATSLTDSGLLSTEEQSHTPNQTAKQWIQAVGSWAKTVTTYAKLDLDFIQVMCLMLIARQAIAYEGDLSWLGAGSLVREAMMIGLHRDPSNFKGISPFLAETRRRLWYTVMELDLQAALDTGVPATISEDEFDCAPPSDLNDEDLSPDSIVVPPPKHATVLTRTSFQVSLAQSLSSRIKVVKIVNRVRLKSTYQDVLDLSEIITTNLSQSPFLVPDHDSVADEGSFYHFRKSLYLFLVYRYILALHRPFVLSLAEVRTEMYTFSRRICIQACLSLLSPLKLTEDTSLGTQQTYPHILRLRGGMFRSELFHAAVTLCFELRLQVKDNLLPALPGATTDYATQNNNQRDILLDTVKSAIKYFEFKVRTEKQACKAFMLLNMVYVSAQSELLSGTGKHSNCGTTTNDLTLENACPLAARRCRELLLEGDGQADCQHSEENWLGYPGNPFMNKEVTECQVEHGNAQPNTSVPMKPSDSDLVSTMPIGSSDPDLFVSSISNH